MAKNRIKVCWLLLLVLMYTASAVLAVGETQARYETTVVQNTLVQSGEKGITSNCLVTKNEAPVTVLVGELSYYTSKSVSFWLKSSGAEATGKLAWSVEKADHLSYLNISMSSGSDSIGSGDDVGLLKDAKMEITMNIMPTPLARSEEHGPMKINILVTWGDEMWGTFQVILPAVTDQTQEETPDGEGDDEDPERVPENTAPSKEPEENGETGNDGTLTEPTEPDTIEKSQSPPETTDQNVVPASLEDAPTDPETEPENTEPSEPETQPTEPSVPEEPTDPTGETEGSGEPTEPTEPDEPTEPAEPTEPEQPEDPIRLETIRRFDPAEKLPVKLSLTEEVTFVRLGLWEVDQEATEDPEKPVMKVGALPNRTRFSLNQGESYYMLYDGCIAEFSLQGMTELSVLLDLSHADLEEDQELVLAMEAYVGDAKVASCRAVTTPDAKAAFQTRAHAAAQPAALTDNTSSRENRIMNRDTALEFTLPLEWADYDLEYSVEILGRGEDGSLRYRNVDLSAGSLNATYTNYDGVHNLVLMTGQTLPQAGTYRLNMKWSYEGICYAELQTTFFINYSAYTTYTPGSQEVP